MGNGLTKLFVAATVALVGVGCGVNNSESEPTVESASSPLSPALKAWSSITLECLGHIPGPRWLDGRTEGGSVGLASDTDYPYTGTSWSIYRLGDCDFVIECLGHIPGPRWLDGSAADGSVSLSYTRSPGTHWIIYDLGDGEIALACQDESAGHKRWLDGRTEDGSVGLAPSLARPYTGSHWKIHQ